MPSVYITQEDYRAYGRHWHNALDNVGIEVSLIPALTKYVLPLSDLSGLEISKLNKNYMSLDSFNMVTDRIDQQGLSIDVIPAIIPRKPEDFDYFGDIPLFVKFRRTYLKNLTDGYNYSSWNTPAKLRDVAHEQFWENQNNPGKLGEYIIQPLVPYPHDNYMVSCAVNEASEVLFNYVMHIVYNSTNHFDLATTPAVPPEGLLDNIQKVCKELNIKGGIFDIEFIKCNGKWCLMDWNPRPALGMSTGRCNIANIKERALAHMVGLPLPEKLPFYMEQRMLPIDFDQAILARQMGFFVRKQYLGNSMTNLSYDATTQQEVYDKFEELKASCS